MNIKDPKNLVLVLMIVVGLLFAGLCFVNIIAAMVAFIVELVIMMFGVFVYHNDLRPTA